MDTESFWQAYSPNETMDEFRARCGDADLRTFVEVHVEGMPQLYGIVRRADWPVTFSAVRQYTRAEVTAGLLICLEQAGLGFAPDQLPRFPRGRWPEENPAWRAKVDVPLDQGKSLDETLRQLTEVRSGPVVALPINVGVDQAVKDPGVPPGVPLEAAAKSIAAETLEGLREEAAVDAADEQEPVPGPENGAGEDNGAMENDADRPPDS